MKVKLAKIQAAQSGFLTIMRASMPIKVSYAVSKNLKKIASELENMEKLRMDLINKYGAKDEKTGGMQVTKENMEIFNKEYMDLMTQEVELDIWKISLNKLIEAGVRISPEQLIALDDFIDDDTQPAAPAPVVPPAAPTLVK